MATKKLPKATKKNTGARKRETVGESIIEGLKQAIAWTRGENYDVRVTLVHVPEVDVREVRAGEVRVMQVRAEQCRVRQVRM